MEEVRLNVEVNNLGEDAHKTVLTVLLPDSDSLTFIQASVSTDLIYTVIQASVSTDLIQALYTSI